MEKDLTLMLFQRVERITIDALLFILYHDVYANKSMIFDKKIVGLKTLCQI
jgi:hypothetical protein